MDNLEKYNKAFTDSFMIKKSQLPSLAYQDVNEWDSVGHMSLIAELEDYFEIEMDIDDITNFSSYEKGKEILSKYKVEIK